MGFQLSDLATRFDLELKGQSEAEIFSVASLQDAGDGDISFCIGRRHLAILEKTRATAVILPLALSDTYQGNALLSENPHASFAKIAQFLHPQKRKPAGVHATAKVHTLASVHESASIAQYAIIEKSAVVTAGCEIGAGCYIGEGVVIGENTVLKNNVTLCHETVIGKACVLYSGCVIGSDGFGHAREGNHWIPIPQLGKVVIGNDVRIGVNTTVDRGALGDTIIGNGVKIDNHVHIGHNVSVGDDTAFAAFVGIAGSTKIGKRCTFAGQVGVADNIEICDDVHITGQSGVRSDIKEAGVYSSGVLLEKTQNWSRNAMRFKQLNDLFRQVKDLTMQDRKK